MSDIHPDQRNDALGTVGDIYVHVHRKRSNDRRVRANEGLFGNVNTIQFSFAGDEPTYKVEFSSVNNYSDPHWKRVRFTFIEGYKYEDEDEVNILVGMKEDGTNEFFLPVSTHYFDMMHSIPQEVLDEYPIEIVDSGITSIVNANNLDGWVDLLVFGDVYHVEIEGIKYTPGYSGGSLD